MHLDKITEAIAHFIGLFQIETEQARLRNDYLEFKALQAREAPPDQHDHTQVTFQSPYDFNDPDPGLHYVPAAPAIVPLKVVTSVAYAMPEIPVAGATPPVIYPQYAAPPLLRDFLSSMRIVELTPPGSVAVHISQINNLSDNDFVNVGTNAVAFHAIGMPALALDALLDDASQFSPIGAATFGAAEDIGTFITDAAASLNAFAAGIEAAQAQNADDPFSPFSSADGISVHADVSLISEPEADAIYINGRIFDEAPKLDDVLPAASPLVRDAADTPAEPLPGGNHQIQGVGSTATGETVHGQGEISGPTSVEIGAGSNVLWNSATLVNEALEGNVFAVAGNHFELNAIIQVNAWSDSDSIGASLSGWGNAAQSATTAAFNIAQMQHIDTESGAAASNDPAQLGFPKAWAITEIHGDFVSLNWVQQLNFVLDNDTSVVASSSGVTMRVGMGENQGFNDLSLADLGKYYDLILVGGNYYDANIITQTNVLLDDDVVGALTGFHTSGQGSVSASDNLLWNDAKITSIDHDMTGALPSGFYDALHGFAAGGKMLPASVLQDSAFQGLEGLRVLYISGSIYDLQYVSQTNVLGDADHVALAMNSAAQADLNADWTITTGSNTLVNSAQIIDVDPSGKTYFGGDHYSDELLVQTDVIRTDHGLQIKDADHLVNEAVAFLSDDMIKTTPEDSFSHLRDDVGVHSAHSDIMQSVVS
ncbi:type I secretion protein [Mesorhizobium sp. A556]